MTVNFFEISETRRRIDRMTRTNDKLKAHIAALQIVAQSQDEAIAQERAHLAEMERLTALPVIEPLKMEFV